MKAILCLLAVTLATVALAAPAVAADKYIPGVTDFPRAPQAERYIPGVTDFPSRANESENGGLQRYISGVTDFPSYVPATPSSPAVETYVTDGFDWIDAGVGAAVGLAIGTLAGVLLLAVRRRAGLTTA